METQILEQFGFTKNEITIFLVLVKKDSASATTVAKETGLNRPYVYYALERLLEKGYISQIKVMGKKHFKTLPLDQIKALEEHKLDILNRLVENLKTLQHKQEDEISVEVIKGSHAIKNIFKLILSEIRPKQELLSLGLDEEKMESLEPIYIKKVLNYFKQQKITERLIIKQKGKTLPYATITTYRSLKPELIGNTAKIIYQDTVIELLYGLPFYAIIIKNKNLADTARKQFEFFWKQAQHHNS